MNVACTFAEPN